MATVGSNLTGQLGDGTTTSSTTAVLASGLRLVLNDWLTSDPDDDGLATWRDGYAAGLDPLNPDTNGNGVPDGAEATDGASADDPDLDDDGVPNWVEMTRGNGSVSGRLGRGRRGGRSRRVSAGSHAVAGPAAGSERSHAADHSTTGTHERAPDWRRSLTCPC